MPLDHALPKHRPYRNSGAIFQIGLKPMDPERWLDTGPDHAAFMAMKRERLKGRPPLFYRSIPESFDAQSELLNAVTAQVLKCHGAQFKMDGGHLIDLVDGSRHDLADTSLEPLEIVGNALEEDFILFQKRAGQDIITAASNAYTSSGRIVSCVGRDMRYAHDPVPGLNEQLAARIDRVLANIQKGAPVVRFNWFITAISSRLFPQGWHEANVSASEQVARSLHEDHRLAGELLWLRVERQTFLRLPETEALAFGIHTYSDQLSSISNDRESLEAMHRLLGEYSKDRLNYSAMLATRAPVLRWIEDKLA
ncbi:DUF3445 domain-containing protein [Aestuariivirga sp.]|uniref:heme-dependent oxidative N-demethylase family protein n=1 Tax=Aestuariivirga sp. TaxID=2650926 RepID=UPI00359487B3